jgi:hypothetical protein
MSALRVVGLVLGFTLPLFAQRPSLNERQLGTYKGNEDAVRSAMSYCNVIYDSLQEQQPASLPSTRLMLRERGGNTGRKSRIATSGTR